MSDNKIQAILDTTMDKLKAMVNADVITGDPIVVDGLTLIPVSKVAYGIATGGSDFATKNQLGLFGGGSGAGVTVSPIAFMVIKEESVRMLPVAVPPSTTADRIVEQVPDVLEQIASYFDSRKKKDAE